jgi:hypothetical protein
MSTSQYRTGAPTVLTFMLTSKGLFASERFRYHIIKVIISLIQERKNGASNGNMKRVSHILSEFIGTYPAVVVRIIDAHTFGYTPPNATSWWKQTAEAYPSHTEFIWISFR